jgi:hypothetical protein
MPNTVGRELSMHTYGRLHFAWQTMCTCTCHKETGRHRLIYSHRWLPHRSQGTSIHSAVQFMYCLNKEVQKDQNGMREQESESTWDTHPLTHAASLWCSTPTPDWSHLSSTSSLMTCSKLYLLSSFNYCGPSVPDSRSLTSLLQLTHRFQIRISCHHWRQHRLWSNHVEILTATPKELPVRVLRDS